jgi:glycosyltransferase involved in cell wall biosynthesis
MGLRVCQLCAVDFTLKHFLVPLIDRMEGEGWEVTSVCSEGPAVLELRNAGYKIHTIEISRSFNLFCHFSSLINLYWYFKRERFDVIHVHTPIAGLLGRLAGWMAGTNLIIYTAHGFYFHDEMSRLKRWFFLRLEKIACRFCDLLFIQSSEDAALAVNQRLLPETNILEIGNGVNLSKFQPLSTIERSQARLSLQIPEHAVVVGIIGRLVLEKGYLEFIDAMRELSASFPDLHVLIVGAFLDNEHGRSVQAEIEQLSLEMGNRLTVMGYRSDVRQLIGAMDIFCLPSHREGLPRSIIEAMMMAKPVVATDIRGSREEVVDGQTGFLVPLKDSSRLASAIGKLLLNETLAIKLGLAGRERAMTFYDEALVVSKQINKIKQFSKRH